jgi:hypothetical protein
MNMINILMTGRIMASMKHDNNKQFKLKYTNI